MRLSAMLLKGDHATGGANDFLYINGAGWWFEGRRVANPNTHGTGCILSSAIKANLAKGYALEEAVARAKEYLTDTLSAMLNLGGGSEPMDHAIDLKPEYRKLAGD